MVSLCHPEAKRSHEDESGADRDCYFLPDFSLNTRVAMTETSAVSTPYCLEDPLLRCIIFQLTHLIHTRGALDTARIVVSRNVSLYRLNGTETSV